MFKKEFPASGTFGAIDAARSWVEDKGFSVGSMCGDMPMGLLLGDINIAKWRNLTREEIGQLHGRITSTDFREGSVTVEIEQSLAETLRLS